jgi:hypothetical protein
LSQIVFVFVSKVIAKSSKLNRRLFSDRKQLIINSLSYEFNKSKNKSTAVLFPKLMSAQNMTSRDPNGLSLCCCLASAKAYLRLCFAGGDFTTGLIAQT